MMNNDKKWSDQGVPSTGPVAPPLEFGNNTSVNAGGDSQPGSGNLYGPGNSWISVAPGNGEQTSQSRPAENRTYENPGAGNYGGGGNVPPETSRTVYVEPPQKKKKRGIGKAILMWVLVVVVAGGAGFGGGLAFDTYFAEEPPVAGTPAPGLVGGQSITINPDSNINAAEAIAAKVIPSVVGVSTESEQTYQSFFGQYKGKAQGYGTGIIVDAAGYILTNSHVVNDGNVTTLLIQLADGRELEGLVLWSDASLDLAVVKVEAENLPVAELGDSDTVNIGAYAVAIGNPLGLNLERSVTQGCISGLNRTLTVTNNDGSQVTMEDLIQTDASINSGNSGGPLLNSKGQVIGVNSAKVTGGEGLGFAIPINTAKPILEEIKATGTFTKGYLGISGVDVAEYRQYFPQAQLNVESGIIVAKVYEGSPAEAAGLKQEDIITAIDGKNVAGMKNLQRYLFNYQDGDKVVLSVIRGGHEMEVEVTLSDTPAV
ncbi:MAG: PDZ domain-containing protein [Clostridiales bacterium]|nr:PDZ domain-containing protein [Clostridiales bacterium]